MTFEKLKQELNSLIRFPGLTNVWVMPIKNRIDMLATGIRTLPGTVSASSERVVGGRYVTIDIDRMAAARFALNIAAVQEVVRTAPGGMQVAETVECLERYPINIRYPRDVLIIMGTLPLALVGGCWLLYLLGYNLSITVGVGFIALAGVAVEIDVVMLVVIPAVFLLWKRRGLAASA